MPNSIPSDLPTNIVFIEEVARDFLRLDGHQKRLVVKALCKIAGAPSNFGKPLGHKSGLPLTGLRSVYIDKKTLRIVWTVTLEGTIEVALIAGIAQRTDFMVYELVARRLGRLSEAKGNV